MCRKMALLVCMKKMASKTLQIETVGKIILYITFYLYSNGFVSIIQNSGAHSHFSIALMK